MPTHKVLVRVIAAFALACDATANDPTPPTHPPGPFDRSAFDQPSAVSDELIVGLTAQPGTAPSCLNGPHFDFLSPMGVEVVREYRLIRACRIRFRPPIGPALLAQRAQQIAQRTDLFDRVGPNHELRLEQAPNDDFFETNRQWGLVDISAPDAWLVTKGNANVRVAVIDSGIQDAHPDLAGQVDLGNSYNFVDDNQNADDTAQGRHGTQVAGVIGARTNNDIGVAGTSWEVTMLALKVSPENRGLAVDAAEAVKYAVLHGAHVINASWSLEDDDIFLRTELLAASKVLVVVAAPTDEGDPLDVDKDGGYPCSYPFENILCITASGKDGELASSWGATTVDLAAPGVDIYSTWASPHYRQGQSTSMAAPFVSGAAALILSACPSIGVANLRTSLLHGKPLAIPSPKKIASGLRLDAKLALEQSSEMADCTPTVAPPPPQLLQ